MTGGSPGLLPGSHHCQQVIKNAALLVTVFKFFVMPNHSTFMIEQLSIFSNCKKGWVQFFRFLICSFINVRENNVQSVCQTLLKISKYFEEFLNISEDFPNIFLIFFLIISKFFWGFFKEFSKISKTFPKIPIFSCMQKDFFSLFQ